MNTDYSLFTRRSAISVRRRSSILPILISLGGVSAGWSATITAGFPKPSFDGVIAFYEEQGFLFSAERIEYTADYRDASPATDGTLRIMGSTGSNILRIEKTDGAPFSLFQLKMQTTAYTTPPGQITGTETLTGFRRTGGTVQQTFSITQDWALFTLPGTFQDLLYVTVPQNVFGGFNIDDVVLDPMPVPEPKGAMILTLGLCALVASHRSRRAAGASSNDT